MGKAFIDTSNKLSEEDISSLCALHHKQSPDATMPAFGAPNQETWLIRDEGNNNHIVGFIHLEHSVEIRAMVTDPDYEHKKMALTIAQSSMETCLRRFGNTHYYISVPNHHEHVRRFYEDVAEEVDRKSVRYLKRL